MFIKKIILSTLIILGVIASTQAQSFDFRCVESGSSQEELDFGFDRNQDPQFEEGEPEMLLSAGFVQGGARSDLAGDNGRVADINHYSNQFEIGESGVYARVTIDAEDDGSFVVATINFNGRGGSYDTFAEALLNANAILNGGLITSEEEMLDAATFNEDTSGIYNMVTLGGIAPNTFEVNVSIRLVDGRFQLDGSDFVFSYLEANVTYYNTLAEALAALALVDFTSL